MRPPAIYVHEPIPTMLVVMGTSANQGYKTCFLEFLDLILCKSGLKSKKKGFVSLICTSGGVLRVSHRIEDDMTMCL